MTRDEWTARLVARATEAERLGALAPVAAVLRDVLAEAQAVDGWPTTPPAPDTLVTLEEAAARLAVTPRWLREERPPYVVQLGDKTLRVSEQKLARWLTHHQNGGRSQLDYAGRK